MLTLKGAVHTTVAVYIVVYKGPDALLRRKVLKGLELTDQSSDGSWSSFCRPVGTNVGGHIAVRRQ